MNKETEEEEVRRLTEEIQILRELAGPVPSHFDLERIWWRMDRIDSIRMKEEFAYFVANNLYPPHKK